MCRAGAVIEPDVKTADYHAWKYGVQVKMYGEHLSRRTLHPE